MQKIDYQIGDIVSNNKYGNGKIIDINLEFNRITVAFFNDPNNPKKMNSKGLTFVSRTNDTINNKLRKSNLKQPKNKIISFKPGDKVYHKDFGNGLIKSLNGFIFAVVKFDNGKEIEVKLNELEEYKVEIFSKDETNIEEKKTFFRIIPSDYNEQSFYSNASKKILDNIKSMNIKNGVATITSTSKKSSEFLNIFENGAVGVLVDSNKGVIVFKMIEDDIEIELLSNNLFTKQLDNIYNKYNNYYVNSFLNSLKLCKFNNDKKILSFPMKFILVCQNVDLKKFSKAKLNSIAITNRNIYFKNFETLFDNNELFSNFNPYFDGFKTIDKDLYGTIVERVVPENATIINIEKTIDKEVTVNSITKDFVPITREEKKFKALVLDDEQIRFINNTKPGHYLTLANPGTGKSVILVSKAYRLYNMYEDNSVLITCYNNNLAEHHNIFANYGNFNDTRLHIETFNKFASKLLCDYDPDYVRSHKGILDPENFHLIVSRLNELLDSGKIETKLNAIFIDEVQLFEPSWIDICYRLLDTTKPCYFEMYGDINQNVRAQKSKGKASWQNTKYVPQLIGRVRYLNTNYRNTDIIANYINSMITEFNSELKKYNKKIDDSISCLSSKTVHKGNIKVNIFATDNKKVDLDASRVLMYVNTIIEKQNADYNDIAIVYPAKGFGKFYSIKYHIEKQLDDNNIPYTSIAGDKKVKLFESDGVILSTIDSCLGLDFKYVILCGLHYWDQFYNSAGNVVNFTKKLLDTDIRVLDYYEEIGKKIYSACSRAKEGLYIVDDLNDNSPIKQIIRCKSGRRYYNDL